MRTKKLEGRQADEVREAVERAVAYASQNKVPLTVERLAAELGMSVTTLRGYLSEEYKPPARARAVVEMVRRAAQQATASVVEYALTRGSSPNMHMMYLKQYAGYGDKDAAPDTEPVVFAGEQEI